MAVKHYPSTCSLLSHCYPNVIPLLSLLNHRKQFKTTIIHVSFVSIVVIKSSYSINLLNCFTILLYFFLVNEDPHWLRQVQNLSRNAPVGLDPSDTDWPLGGEPADGTRRRKIHRNPSWTYIYIVYIYIDIV